MSGHRKVVVLVVGAALAVAATGLGAAGAIAASRMLSPNEESKAVIEDAAEQLGIEPSALSDALKQALGNRIDEAVESDKLTEAQAERLKERLDSAEVPLLFGMGGVRPHGFGKGFGFWHRGPIGHFGSLEEAAKYLGMTQAELREALRDKTLAEIAEEQGKTAAGLVDALVAAQTQRIDEAVREGKLNEDQATRLKEGLERRVEALVAGELRQHRFGRHGFRPGSWAPRAPPAQRGSSS